MEWASFILLISLYLYSDNSDSADLWLLNSCTVKNPAEDHFLNEVMKGRKAGKHVVVAGCVPQGQPRSEYIQVNHNVAFSTCHGPRIISGII